MNGAAVPDESVPGNGGRRVSGLRKRQPAMDWEDWYLLAVRYHGEPGADRAERLAALGIVAAKRTSP